MSPTSARTRPQQLVKAILPNTGPPNPGEDADGPNAGLGLWVERTEATGPIAEIDVAIARLARLAADGEVDLGALEEADDAKAVAVLTALPGIGRWSAEYTLPRGQGRWHVLPGDDVGGRNNLRRRFGLAGTVATRR